MTTQPDWTNISTIELSGSVPPPKPWSRAVAVAAALVILLAVGYYAYSFREYLTYITTGFTGAGCLKCDYQTGKIVLDIVPRSPADRAGIMRDDTLLKVDKIASSDLPQPAHDYDEPAPYAEPGTQVSLTVRNRAGAEKEYIIVREQGWQDLASVGPLILGASQPLSVVLALGADVLIALAYIGVGAFMIWRKSNDWLVILAGLGLALVGNYSARAPLFLPMTLLTGLYTTVSLSTFYVLFFVFPDGKMVPRWAPVLIVVYVIWQLLFTLVIRPMVGTWSAFRVFDVGFWSVAVVMQVYRYRKLSTPTQRQQTKWVLLGLSVCIAERFLFLIVGSSVPALNIMVSSTPLSYLFFSFGDTLGRLALIFIPLTFMIGVLRYRLWDVDFVINRTIVYGLLTCLLGMLLLGALTVTLYFFQNLVGGPVVAMAASGAIFGAIFQPARRQLQALVDQRLYKIYVDYQSMARRPDPKSILAGRVISGYEDLKLIGRGGMAEIYKGRQVSLDRPVAIKALPTSLADNAQFRQRFKQEAQTIAALKHPNIVQVFDVGEIDGLSYIVMEYIEGKDLTSYIREGGSLTLDKTRQILRSISEALDFAHREGVIHRDVKPSNVMIEAKDLSDPKMRPVLMDFGIARILSRAGQLTGTGVIGSFSYISPEQISAAKDIDGRADIYSLGVMTYQMLTGALPFSESSPGALLMAHMNQPAPNPKVLRPELPDRVANAILKALEKSPDKRWPNAGAFVKALDKAKSDSKASQKRGTAKPSSRKSLATT